MKPSAKTKSVYLVFIGDYDDTECKGAFLTRAEADYAAKCWQGHVERHPLGYLPKHQRGMWLWRVNVTYGRAVECADLQSLWPVPKKSELGVTVSQDGFLGVFYARTKQKAVALTLAEIERRWGSVLASAAMSLASPSVSNRQRKLHFCRLFGLPEPSTTSNSSSDDTSGGPTKAERTVLNRGIVGTVWKWIRKGDTK